MRFIFLNLRNLISGQYAQSAWNALSATHSVYHIIMRNIMYSITWQSERIVLAPIACKQFNGTIKILKNLPHPKITSSNHNPRYEGRDDVDESFVSMKYELRRDIKFKIKKNATNCKIETPNARPTDRYI